MSTGNIKGWGNWQEKLKETERKEEKNWNREKYNDMNTKRVEWFVLVALIGLFVILVGIGMMQYVGRARRMAHVSNVNAIRTALQCSYTIHETELEKTWKTGEINFYISPVPEEVPDDQNGSILRNDIDSLLVSAGVYKYRIHAQENQIGDLEQKMEQDGQETEETGWIYEVVQQSGTLTINYWSEYNNYEEKPEEPDCVFTASGPPDSCLAALDGSYR